jgi:AsmA-like C-terminal region
MAGMVSGPVALDANYARDKKGKAQAILALDLGEAQLTVPELGWTKPAGNAANAKLTLDLADDKLTAIRDATLIAGAAEAQLSASFNPAAGDALQRVDIRRIAFGDTNIAGAVTRRKEGGWRLQLNGPSFDAQALFKNIDSNPTGQAGDQPPLVIEAQFERVVLGVNRIARNFRGQLFSDGQHWQAASIDAAMADGGTLTLRFGTVAGDKSLRASTDNFGGLLALLDISSNVRGGRLDVTGTVEDEGPRRILRGSAVGSDYRVTGAPLFARLLSAASLSGIGALLSGQGIPFSRLQGNFVYGDGRIAVDNFRAYGGAIGINVQGEVDDRDNTLDLSGTLVPAYTLNSVLGNIPVLGELLVGGKGQGLFAANFRVAGSLDDPSVSINPLSALAPGVLRKLFIFSAPNPSPAAAAPNANTGTP